MKLVKEFEFDAAHKLNDYVGKCANVHGHTWRVVVEIDCNMRYIKPDFNLSKKSNGILIDFTKIKAIANKFDHKYLNDVISINPTAENLASIICLIVTYEMLERFVMLSFDHFVVTVKVWESKTSHIEVNNFDAFGWLGLADVTEYKEFIEKYIDEVE